MKNLIIILILFETINIYSQGYEIESNFYPSAIPEMKTWEETIKYWEDEIKSLNAQIEKSKSNPELLYKLAIARNNSNDQNLFEVIELLDKAIIMNPKKPEYYAVRGIIKYNWGAWSSDYDIGEGCPDVKKAIAMGLLKELKSNISIQGILNHPSCK